MYSMMLRAGRWHHQEMAPTSQAGAMNASHAASSCSEQHQCLYEHKLRAAQTGLRGTGSIQCSWSRPCSGYSLLSTWASELCQLASSSPPGELAAAPGQPSGTEEAVLCHVLGREHLDTGQGLAAVRPTTLSVAFLPSWHMHSGAAAAGQQRLIVMAVLVAAHVSA